jgi:hypothetical protein
LFHSLDRTTGGLRGHPRHLARADVGMVPRYAVRTSKPQENTAAPPHEEPRTTWSKSSPPVLWRRAILRGHTQNTNEKTVKLCAEAHSKGRRGSAYEGASSTTLQRAQEDRRRSQYHAVIRATRGAYYHQQRRLPGKRLLHLPRHRVPPVRPQTGTDYPDQDAPQELVAAGCAHLHGQRVVPIDQEAG